LFRSKHTLKEAIDKVKHDLGQSEEVKNLIDFIEKINGDMPVRGS